MDKQVETTLQCMTAKQLKAICNELYIPLHYGMQKRFLVEQIQNGLDNKLGYRCLRGKLDTNHYYEEKQTVLNKAIRNI